MKLLPTFSAIPLLGFGTYKLVGNDCYHAVRAALEIGYRHIDTAVYYGNHHEIARAIADSGVDREEIFLTSKIFRDELTHNAVINAADRILIELNTHYLDLLLIHWPNHEVPVAETLGAMEELRQQGKLRNLGVSNFTIAHLEEVLATGIAIINNQVELHPEFNQLALREFCQAHNIAVTAYAPLARGAALVLPAVQEIADRHGKPPAQVVLNWMIQQNIVTIPKATARERIQENFDTQTWQLTSEEIEQINQQPQSPRTISPEWNEF